MDKTNFLFRNNTQEKDQKRVVKQSLIGVECPFCNHVIPKEFEFCPNCGKKLVSYCTFCGCPMDPGKDICPDCGMPYSGIICRNCGTLNHRSFCRKCNTPLTKAAERAVDRALNDPTFEKCKELCEKANQIENYLSTHNNFSEKSISDSLLELEMVINTVNEQKENERINDKICCLRSEYNSIVSDINDLFSQMLPPVGSTPQEQRNYYSARKVAFTKIIKSKRTIGWVCNWCGYTHMSPSECGNPALGGKWIYEEDEHSITEYKYKYK